MSNPITDFANLDALATHLREKLEDKKIPVAVCL